jgi:hypothetical protein
MLATSLGSRLPQVDPAWVVDVNAVEGVMLMDRERELLMPCIFTRPSNDVHSRLQSHFISTARSGY